jgi:uncharacterized membrane protein
VIGDMSTFDVIALAISLLLFVAYHVFLARRLSKDRFYTVHAVNNYARLKWVETVMSADNLAVLAVQTLRNSVMAASFMASTAILLMIGTLTISGSAQNAGGVWHVLNVSGTTHEGLLAWKLMALLADFFVAFFCFATAVRFFNHVGYMINIPARLALAPVGPRRVAAYLDRAGHFYVIGTRSFFYCVPLVFWLFGPQFMLIATMILLFGLYRLDRAPTGAGYEDLPL